MDLSVQDAARRLGVSPHTIRRWTTSGLLPCTRTAGGHRRIRQADVDELSRLLGDSSHLAARLSRERELEALMCLTLALADEPDDGALLHEIARQLTALLDAHRCVLSGYRPETGRVSVLATFDRRGRRAGPDPRRREPSAAVRRAVESREHTAVSTDAPGADPADVAELRRDGDRSLLVLPLVHRGRTVGAVELFDRTRARHFSPHELRLAQAVATQAAVALYDTGAGPARDDRDLQVLRNAVAALAEGCAAVLAQTDRAGVLATAAALAVRALDAVSCVAGLGDLSAGASGPLAEDGGPRTDRVRVVVGAAPCGAGTLTLTATLHDAAGSGAEDVMSLLAALAAGAAAGV